MDPRVSSDRHGGSTRLRVTAIAFVFLALVASGCGSNGASDGATDRATDNAIDLDSADVALPARSGPRTETSHSVPHVQNFVDPVPDVDLELRRRIYSLPGVEERPTIVSFTGTTALWLTNDFEFQNPNTTLREREFAHIHPDGSLHTVLPVELAIEATTAKWAELHPWVGRDDFWSGMVMLYTPQDFEELEVTWRLVVDSYNFVTNQDLDPDDFR